MSDRQVIAVDIETTSLRLDAAILEVAAVNLETEEEFRFVPYVPMEAFADAEPVALAINGYFERRIREQMLGPDMTAVAYHKLRQMLVGNTLAGSNPTFDAARLAGAQYVDPTERVTFGGTPFRRNVGEAWHHRLLDLSAYAAGVLGLPLGELPGLHTVCELVGVTNKEEHSALGDARATAECFIRLMAVAQERRKVNH